MSKRPWMIGEVFGWCGIARRCAAGGLEMRMKSRFSHLGQPRPPRCRAPPAHRVHLGARKPCPRSGRNLEQGMRVYTIFYFPSSCATTGNMNPGRRGSSKRLAARGQSREFGQKAEMTWAEAGSVWGWFAHSQAQPVLCRMNVTSGTTGASLGTRPLILYKISLGNGASPWQAHGCDGDNR